MRAQGHGRIQRIEGLRAIERRLGPSLLRHELLPIGARRRNWKQTLLSDGFVAVRHPDHSVCIEMMQALIGKVQLYAR